MVKLLFWITTKNKTGADHRQGSGLENLLRVISARNGVRCIHCSARDSRNGVSGSGQHFFIYAGNSILGSTLIQDQNREFLTLLDKNSVPANLAVIRTANPSSG